MAHRPSFINQVACNLGFLAHPTADLFPQYIFTTESFLGYKSVEITEYTVQRSVNMSVAGATGVAGAAPRHVLFARRPDRVSMRTRTKKIKKKFFSKKFF